MGTIYLNKILYIINSYLDEMQYTALYKNVSFTYLIIIYAKHKFLLSFSKDPARLKKKLPIHAFKIIDFSLNEAFSLVWIYFWTKLKA